jgi:hypothetical protein
MRSRARQAGVSLVLLALVVLIGVAIFIAVKLLERREDTGTRGVETGLRFNHVQDALVSFVAQNQRLPCPADPALDTGDADPLGASAGCNSAKGTIPWKTIGMGRDDSFDRWGNKISYRVFSGTTGLTQSEGASTVHCDTSNLDPATGVVMGTAVLGANGLCDTTHDHLAGLPLPALPGTFLFGKGLQVNDFGTTRTDIAYVLISHGPTGLGAYTAAGVQKALPTSASELANIDTTTPAAQFVSQASSSPEIPADAATHFDDLLAFRGISEIITQANLLARDWPENSLLNPATPGSLIAYTMNTATIAAAGVSASPGDLGTGTINFGSGADRARVRGFDSGGNQNISLDSSGGSEALGVAGNGGNLITNTNSERLRIDFATPGRKLGIALAHFGTYVVAGVTYTEQVQFRFSGGGSTVNVTKGGCHADGGVASFSIDPGVSFSRVEIRPQAASPSGLSALALADFNECSSTAPACFSKLATLANQCP